mgnify:CR=1 FL=1
MSIGNHLDKIFWRQLPAIRYIFFIFCYVDLGLVDGQHGVFCHFDRSEAFRRAKWRNLYFLNCSNIDFSIPASRSPLASRNDNMHLQKIKKDAATIRAAYCKLEQFNYEENLKS